MTTGSRAPIGEHGDVPLEPGAGKVIADLVVEQPGAYILDLSSFESNAAQDRFVTDFAERLYRLKATHRQPLHLIVDEADSFAPQRPMPGQQRMLGAFEAIVRRGRIRGLGVTLITQRPAVLNKNCLTQVECLVVLQITGPQDRKAIDEWVAGNGTKEERDVLIASLASLKQGEAWFWSPAWLRVFVQAKVRRRRTFDSSRTPEPEPEVRIERIEVPVLNGQVEQLEQAIARLSLVGGELVQAGVHIGGIATEIVGVADDLLGALRRVAAADDGAHRGLAGQPGAGRMTAFERARELIEREAGLRASGRLLELIPARRADADRLFGLASGLRRARLALLVSAGVLESAEPWNR